MNLDAFTRSYIETALWSSMDESDPHGDEPLDANYGPEDVAPEAIEVMTQDCARFQEENASMLRRALEAHGQDEERCGHDLWLTRNGHGAGYFDGDYSRHGINAGEVGTALGKAATALGEVTLYVGDDNKIHIL